MDRPGPALPAGVATAARFGQAGAQLGHARREVVERGVVEVGAEGVHEQPDVDATRVAGRPARRRR